MDTRRFACVRVQYASAKGNLYQDCAENRNLTVISKSRTGFPHTAEPTGAERKSWHVPFFRLGIWMTTIGKIERL